MIREIIIGIDMYNKEIENIDLNFYQGYWQSYLYFHEYKSQIKHNLKLVDTENSKIFSYKNQILNFPSIFWDPYFNLPPFKN